MYEECSECNVAFYIDENGGLVSNCPYCPVHREQSDETDEKENNNEVQ